MSIFSSLVAAEVISAEKRRVGTSNEYFYTCEATVNGVGTIFVPNCVQSSMFGGQGDYHRRRLRTREDGDKYPDKVEEILDPGNSDASIGERVYLLFLQGSLDHPVIVGYQQHPSQSDEELDPTDSKLGDAVGSIRSVSQYLGVRTTVDSKGQFRIIHKGAPEVKFVPKTGGLLGDLAGAISATTTSSSKAEPESLD